MRTGTERTVEVVEFSRLVSLYSWESQKGEGTWPRSYISLGTGIDLKSSEASTSALPSPMSFYDKISLLHCMLLVQMLPTFTFNTRYFVNVRFFYQRGFHLGLCFCLFPLPGALCAKLSLWQQKGVQKKVSPEALRLVIPRTPACL